eukprot:Em0113g14a
MPERDQAMKERDQALKEHDKVLKDEIRKWSHVTVLEKVIGGGAWGFVKEGRFRDQRVAVKCVHELILSKLTMQRVYSRDASSANVILKAMAGSEWKAKLGLPIGPRKLVPWEMVPLSIQPQRHFQSTHLSVSSHHGVYSYGILLCEVTLREFPDPATLHEMISKVKAKHASWY